ncbi:hypothetical protein ACTQ6A_01055 [Lachnospiraceae bacterium LCP25S3_G4]
MNKTIHKKQGLIAIKGESCYWNLAFLSGVFMSDGLVTGAID